MAYPQTHEQLADTEARHAHRLQLAERDAEIERLTALLEGERGHVLRLADGLDAILIHASDTLSGPSAPEKPDTQWYCAGVIEARVRSARLLWGKRWNEPIDEHSTRWADTLTDELRKHRIKEPHNDQ